MNIGFLSVLHDPLLGSMLRTFIRSGISPSAVFFDEKDVSQKDLNLFLERTEKRFPEISLYKIGDANIPFYFLKNHNSQVCIDLVSNLGIDLLINAGTTRIIKKNLLFSPRIGVLNCHPGLLPYFRGCTCVEWAIYKNEQVGNTVHFMDEGIDTGPIIISEGLFFSKSERYADVRIKVYKNREILLVKAIKKIIADKLTPSKLPPQLEGNYHTVIDEEKMSKVLEKLNLGLYAFQK